MSLTFKENMENTQKKIRNCFGSRGIEVIPNPNLLFLSHTSSDFKFIINNIDTILRDIIKGGDPIFLHNISSGGASGYGMLVASNLISSAYFIVAISKNTLKSKWVRDEVDWAIRNKKYILSLLIGKCDISKLHKDLITLPCIDFTQNIKKAGRNLKKILHKWKNESLQTWLQETEELNNRTILIKTENIGLYTINISTLRGFQNPSPKLLRKQD